MSITEDKYIGTLLDDRYQIEEIIGEGGMAVVYKAKCNRLNRYVAIKILRENLAQDAEFRSRFNAESQAVAMLSHPNIVSVYDVSHNDTPEYIVMELIDGITLKQYIDKKGAISWKEAIHFSRQIAQALAHAHSKGIIHRDIKPQNIMLLRTGAIKVADFGIAALENHIPENNNGQTFGSVHYMAPEQARGELPDARSDIYSLGIVMYEMLTGTLPFNGSTPGEIAVKHMNVIPTPPRGLVPEIPEELERITLKAMSPDIAKRYQSAEELEDDLNHCVLLLSKENPQQDNAETDGEASDSEPDVVPVRSVSELNKADYRRRRKRSRRVTYCLGVFSALVCSVALFVFLWNFWLGGIFAPAERTSVPNFYNMQYESIINDSAYSAFRFSVSFEASEEVPSGYVISQSPDSGRSVMMSDDGIDITLVVSTGSAVATVPDVTGWDYQAATNEIQLSGLIFAVENEVSDSVPEDCVISTKPAAGEQVAAGSTVYLTVSAGSAISSLTMPNLVGLEENEAIAKLKANNLSYGGCERAASDYDAGVVIGQSVEAFSDTEEHTVVYLRISTGKN